MEVVIGVIAAVVFGGLGLALGRSSGRKVGVTEGRGDVDARLASLTEALRRGRRPEGLASGSAEAALQAALEEGWAPRETERQAALAEAVGRVSAFLDKSVRGPLQGATADSEPSELHDRIDRALGALEDLDFFVRETSEAREGADLAALAQRLTKEFVADQNVGVRLLLGEAHVPASVNPAALMDALYLVLHNAVRFGKGQTIDLTVARDGGRAKVTVRDRGPGFSEEAFRRAFDPFYSTAGDGLGLGLPHARKVVEGMGGRIELRNVPDGGAEVEISFPAG